MEYGDFWKQVNRNCFQTLSLKEIKLQQRLLGSREFFDGGALAVGAISLADLAEFQASQGDKRGAGLLGQQDPGVKASATLRQLEERVWKVSLRTDGSLNATRVCALLGAADTPPPPGPACTTWTRPRPAAGCWRPSGPSRPRESEPCPTGLLWWTSPRAGPAWDVCAKLRRVMGERRVGHAGTLDPLATGVLPVFVGRATRAVEFAEGGEKEYLAVLRLGRSPTPRTSPARCWRSVRWPQTARSWRRCCPRFTGEILQHAI